MSCPIMTLIVSNIVQDFVLQYVGKNGQIPLFGKISNNMPHVGNYLSICPCFETRFYFSEELKFLEKFQVELDFHNFFFFF